MEENVNNGQSDLGGVIFVTKEPEKLFFNLKKNTV